MGLMLFLVLMMVFSLAVVGCDEPVEEVVDEVDEPDVVEEVPADVDADVNWIITTATTGGTYYPVGVGLGTLWTTFLRDEGIRVSAVSSAGSGENIAMLKEGEAELAILQGLFGRSAYRGTGIYEGEEPFEELRSISMLWPNTEHFTMRTDSVTTGTATDIEGTIFVVGRPGSGTEQSTLQIMEGLGLTVDDIQAEYVGYFEAVDLMRDRRADGAALVAGQPVAAVTEAFVSFDTTVLEFTDEQLEAIIENTDYPGYRMVVEAETYPGQEEDINTIAQPNWLGTHAMHDEDVIYALTKQIYEELEYLHGVHDITNFMSLDSAMDGLPVPLHAGAYRYYDEQGLDIPDDLIPPEAQ